MPHDSSERRLALAALASGAIILLCLGLVLADASAGAVRARAAQVVGALLVASLYACVARQALRGARDARRPLEMGVAAATAWLALVEASIAGLMVLPMAQLPGTRLPLFLIGAVPDPGVVLTAPLPGGLPPRAALVVIGGFVAMQIVMLRATRRLRRPASGDARYWWGALAAVVVIEAASLLAPGGLLAASLPPRVLASVRAATERSHDSRPRVASDVEVGRALNRVHACAHRLAAESAAGAWPASLDTMVATGCLPASALSDSVAGWRVTYAPVAADSATGIAGYRLEARPIPGAPAIATLRPIRGDESGVLLFASDPDAAYSYHSPLRSLVDLRTCLEMYRVQRPAFGYPASLAALGPTGNGCLESEGVGLAADSATVTLAGFGYQYRVEYARTPADTTQPGTGIALAMRPMEYGALGVRSYALDDSGRAHTTGDDRAPTTDDPLLPLCDGASQRGECQSPRSLPPPDRDVAPVITFTPQDTTVVEHTEIPWKVTIENSWIANGPYEYTFHWPDGDSTHARTTDAGGEGYRLPGTRPLVIDGSHPLYGRGRQTVRVTVTDARGRTARARARILVRPLPWRR